MVISITYGDEKYKKAKKFNCRMAKKYGADLTIAYGPEDIPDSFKKKNENIWNQPRGGGYWIWKPFIICKTLKSMKEGDYLIYTDAGAVFINPINYLLKTMEREATDIMAFSITHKERFFTKRDVFLLMECDSDAFAESLQICSGYIILKRTKFTEQFMEEFLKYIQDERIVTDLPNSLEKPNYLGFKENRHDQSVFSLLCKKYGVIPFRDPSQFGLKEDAFPDFIKKRSTYPQIINSFRDPNIGNMFQLKYGRRGWYKYLTCNYYKLMLKHMLKL